MNKYYLFSLMTLALIGCGGENPSAVKPRPSVVITPSTVQATEEAPSDVALVQFDVGTLEHTGTAEDWDEFESATQTEQLDTKTLDLANPDPKDVRSWIGHSQCSSCRPGVSKNQRFQFRDLIVGSPIKIRIFYSFLATSSTFSWKAIEGQVSFDTPESLQINGSGLISKISFWELIFTPQTSDALLEISNNLTTGNQYFYIDSVSIELLRPLPVN